MLHRSLLTLAVAGVATALLTVAPNPLRAQQAPRLVADNPVDQMKKDLGDAGKDLKAVPGTVRKEGKKAHKDMKKELKRAKKDVLERKDGGKKKEGPGA